MEVYHSKITLQEPVSLYILWMPTFLEKPVLKFNPMKQELDHSVNTPAKVFVKLTVFGFVLIGFAYFSLIVLGTALKAIH
jgi:D-alanyl-lipoteichoic acid acyltransferase DltB (MBOAT superfamily)